jgi:glutaredoxin/glutathione-dependent peroxiredoxin
MLAREGDETLGRKLGARNNRAEKRKLARSFRARASAEKSGCKGKVLSLSDGNAEFTKKIGMDFDGSGVGLGTRSKRYAMLVEDGVVKKLSVEDSPGVAVESTAEKLLAAL